MDNIPHNSNSDRANAQVRRARRHITGDSESAEAKAGIVDNEASEGALPQTVDSVSGMKQVATTPSAVPAAQVKSAANTYMPRKAKKTPDPTQPKGKI